MKNDSAHLPLWEVTDNAETDLLKEELVTGEPHSDASFEAARIRAIRDWLLPEETKPDQIEYGNYDHWFSDYRDYKQRQQLRSLLTSEADHADQHND